MIAKPKTFSELLGHWSTIQLSADLGVPYVTARKMRERQSVGIVHWPALIEAANRKSIRITYGDLVDMRRASSRQGAAA